MKCVMKNPKELPKNIRVSLGSAIAIGLLNGKLDAAPTTAYLMTYRKGKCTANCGFCPQARKSSARGDMLSRVSWPVFATEKVLSRIEKAVGDGKIKRVCFQALNYPKVFIHLQVLIRAIREKVDVPISISCQPQNSINIKALAEARAERIGIPLDAASEELFDKIKGFTAGGPYNWKNQFRLLSEAVNIFGKGKVSTHLIVGLGETEKEMVETIQKCVDMSVLPALFAFTPIVGTALEGIPQPPIQSYRRIQIARHLIVHGISRYENMRFNNKGCLNDFGIDKQTLMQTIQLGEPFLTSGCPYCNRPYYNEKPSGPIYNYPRKLSIEELLEIKKQLNL
ncbi:MAG: radical SAM protein [Candidatus Bathyarchaeota archaeon]|nr:radical SAM protein [Candidatus Bathyarchaeota archaeon]